MKVDIEAFIDDIMQINPKYEDEIIHLESKYSCKMESSIEKIHSLQETYYYEVGFGKGKNFFLEIESGIDNGTQLNHSEWGVDTKSMTKTQRVLKDIVLDDYFYEEGSFLKRKANAVLSANKHKLFEFHRKNDYDNYVTGGHSKMQLDPLLKKLHLDYIYEEIEVYRNFI